MKCLVVSAYSDIAEIYFSYSLFGFQNVPFSFYKTTLFTTNIICFVNKILKSLQYIADLYSVITS